MIYRALGKAFLTMPTMQRLKRQCISLKNVYIGQIKEDGGGWLCNGFIECGTIYIVSTNDLKD